MKQLKIKNIIFFFIFIVASLFFTIGDSTYIFLSSGTVRPNYSSVAYVTGLEEEQYFPTVEGALIAAKKDGNKNTIYLIPGKNPFIYKNCTVSSEDSLILPFSGTKSESGWSFKEDDYNGRQRGVDGDKSNPLKDFLDTSSESVKYSNKRKDSFADYNQEGVDYWRKNVVTIKQNITLTVFGTLFVGGVTGREGQGLMGGTCGNYTEIAMESNSKIILNGTQSKGTILGYIKEIERNNGSRVEVISGSTLNMPFVIYDFKGGSETGGLYQGTTTNSDLGSSPVAPFVFYNCPNITSLQHFDSESKLIALVDIHTGKTSISVITLEERHSTTDMPLIADKNSIFVLSSGAYIDIKNNPADPRYTDSAFIDGFLQTTNRTHISFHSSNGVNAGLSTDTMSLTIDLGIPLIGKINVKTSEFEWPVSHIYSLEFVSGKHVSNHRFKFMTGSKLIVGKDAELSLKEKVIFYSDKTDTSGFNSKTFSKNYGYPIDKGSAILENNGKLHIQNKFGGIITSKIEGAILDCSSGTMSYACPEGTGTRDGMNFNFNPAILVSETARGYVDQTDSMVNFDKKEYVSKQSSNGIHYWHFEVAELESATFDPASITEEGNFTGNKTLSVLLTPKNCEVTFEWSIIDRNNCTDAQINFENTPTSDSQSVNISFKSRNEGENDGSPRKCTIQCLVRDKNNASKDPVPITCLVTQNYKKNETCITVDTQINMADGTYKRAGDLRFGDMVLAYDHFNGRIIPAPIVINSHIETDILPENLITYLKFDNGKEIGISGEHGFFDVEENQYVYLTSENANDYVNHEFIYIDNSTNSLLETTLVSTRTVFEQTMVCEPATAYHLNIVVDDMLSMPGAISGCFNIFEYDKGNLIYNKEKMEADIAKFGLFTYDDFDEYMSYEVYSCLPAPYFKVAIGKGILTWDILMGYINKWAGVVEDYFPSTNAYKSNTIYTRLWKKDEYYY